MNDLPQSACLIAINPTGDLREYTLRQASTLVGSDPANDLVVQGDTVSRRHANIAYRDGQYEITDLASTNGTFVNDQRVAGSVLIRKGDEIRFGQARFVMSVTSVAKPAIERDPFGIGRTALAVALVLTVVLSTAGGFIGGVFAATRIRNVVVARQFVLVDQDNKPRGVLTVFPQAGDPKCRTCDGSAHLVMLGQQGEPQQAWPPSGPKLDAAQIGALLKLFKLFAAF